LDSSELALRNDVGGEAVCHTRKKNRVIVPVCTSGSDEIVENCVGFLFGCLGDVCFVGPGVGGRKFVASQGFSSHIPGKVLEGCSWRIPLAWVLSEIYQCFIPGDNLSFGTQKNSKMQILLYRKR
jgi:hypothetical protein